MNKSITIALSIYNDRYRLSIFQTISNDGMQDIFKQLFRVVEETGEEFLKEIDRRQEAIEKLNIIYEKAEKQTKLRFSESKRIPVKDPIQLIFPIYLEEEVLEKIELFSLYSVPEKEHSK